MTQTNETALSKRIEWTKEEIQDDRKELAKTLEALSGHGGERGPVLPGEPAPDAVARRWCAGRPIWSRATSARSRRRPAVLEALQKVAEWSGS